MLASVAAAGAAAGGRDELVLDDGRVTGRVGARWTSWCSMTAIRRDELVLDDGRVTGRAGAR